MGLWDIRPFDLESGRHRIRHFLLDPTVTAAGEDTAFLAGNALVVTAADQDILPCVSGTYDPAAGLIYLATCNSAGLITHHNLADPVGAACGVAVPVYDFSTGAEFATAFISAGDDTQLDLDDATVDIGSTADIWVDDVTATLVGHIHGLDNTGDYFTITRKLDALGRDSVLSGAATTELVFAKII